MHINEKIQSKMIKTKLNDWIPIKKISFDHENVIRIGLRTYFGTTGAQWYTGLRIITSTEPEEEAFDGYEYKEEGFVSVH